MPEPVSVDDAIQNGYHTIINPVRIIQISTFMLGIFICYRFRLHPFAYVCVIPAAIIVPWIYWSFMITKWRIWAFEHVKEVIELKKRAIEEKLIWPDGSFFENTEFRTAADKERLKLIQKKLDRQQDHLR